MDKLEWRPKALAEWEPKQALKKYGEGFCVEVVRWGKELENSNVYIYIWPGHPLFLRCEQSMWGCPVDLPGASFYKLHRNEKGIITSHQYGSDYNHLWNEEQDADSKWTSAMWDAMKIFEALEAKP